MSTPGLVDAAGRPILGASSAIAGANDAPEGHSSGQGPKEEGIAEKPLANAAAWNWGGPYALGAPDSPRPLPEGVSIVYDKRVDCWALRDEFLAEPVVGYSRFHTTVCAAADAYVAELGRRTRREQFRRSRK
jgi:hypothetical protein